MADLVAIAAGNLTTGATWGVADATGSLVSTNTGSTALTTSQQGSSGFAPGAITVIGAALRLASRATGSPSNTITITLRNSTDSADVTSVTANVSDLPVATAGSNSEGGWHFFKFSAAQLLTAGKNYIIRATLSSTSTAVSLCTDGTSGNWQRLLVTNGTQVPAAGDNLHIMQTLDGATNPATPGNITVTMDSTAATDYGSANTSTYVAALDISKGGTLTWGTAASTTYILQLSGNLIIYSGGTYNQGTVATPIPRTSTATLQLDNAADNDFKIRVMNLGTMVVQGLSRTSGKNIVWTLLTANQAASATTATVADDTGWLNGDEIAIATTTKTLSQSESVTLSVDAGASTLTHGAVTNAHAGSTAEKCQAEVVLLTRNVVIKSVSTTAAFGGIEVRPTAIVDFDWVLVRYMKEPSFFGVYLTTTTGSATFSYCVFRDIEGACFVIDGIVNGGTLTIEHTCGYNLSTTTSYIPFLYYGSSVSPLSLVTINDCVVVTAIGVYAAFRFYSFSKYVVLTNCRCVAPTPFDFEAACDMGGNTIGPLVAHGATGHGINVGASMNNVVANGWVGWRNGNAGIGLAAGTQVNWQFTGTTLCYGNTTDGVAINTPVLNITFLDLRCYGDTSFAQPDALQFSNQCNIAAAVRVESGDFGTASGLFVAHSARDVNISSVSNVDLVLNNCLLAATTELTNSNTSWGVVRIQRRDRTATQHVTKTVWGDLTYETTTVDVSPSLKLTPNITSPLKLESNAGFRGKGFLIPVASGATKTISVKVRKNSSYAGSAPRLILKANPSIGVTTDTVLGTLSVGADTWETLSGTTIAATDDGVFECVVDCDGTAGSVFSDTVAVS